MSGKVTGIYITSQAGADMQALRRVDAVAGRGLVGDRYHDGVGFYSSKPLPGGGRQLTLIAEEALAELAAEGVDLVPAECRRNLITRGVDLHALIGVQFTIGPVLCEGVRDCPPCVHLEELTELEVLGPMAHRGGLRANILTNGEISVGDEITVIA